MKFLDHNIREIYEKNGVEDLFWDSVEKEELKNKYYEELENNWKYQRIDYTPMYDFQLLKILKNKLLMASNKEKQKIKLEINRVESALGFNTNKKIVVDSEDIKNIPMARILNHYGIKTTKYKLFKCPFHKGGNEDKPSASIHPRYNIVRCFTCSKTYNPISFGMEYLRLDFKNTLLELNELL